MVPAQKVLGRGFMKDNIRAATMAAALIAAGLFWWHVATLEDCRAMMGKGDAAGEFLKSGCPQTGPYAANSNVFFFAAMSLLFPSATAEQRSDTLNRER
jgi:hypothetical protein